MLSAEAAAARLEEAFGKVQRTRMQDISILNPRLRVQAVGTRPFDKAWLSVLVTPWFINVMLLPRGEAEAAKWAALRAGASVSQVLPAGRFNFIIGEEAGLGRFQMCSLFSPVLEFADQEAVVAAAEAALAALFDPRQQEAPGDEERVMGTLSHVGPPTVPMKSPAQNEAGEAAPRGGGAGAAVRLSSSRRALLMGAFREREGERG